jgi:hypothetical protein
MNTPKAFANFSPGLERSENPGSVIDIQLTLKGFVGRQTLSGFYSVFIILFPGLWLRSNPGSVIDIQLTLKGFVGRQTLSGFILSL